jgi:hypothetical protein
LIAVQHLETGRLRQGSAVDDDERAQRRSRDRLVVKHGSIFGVNDGGRSGRVLQVEANEVLRRKSIDQHWDKAGPDCSEKHRWIGCRVIQKEKHTVALRKPQRFKGVGPKSRERKVPDV